MKHLLTALAFSIGVVAYAPAVHADCGSCGDKDKPHAHAPGEKHVEGECAGHDKAKGNCEGKDKADAACKCGHPKSECTCEKKKE